MTKKDAMTAEMAETLYVDPGDRDGYEAALLRTDALTCVHAPVAGGKTAFLVHKAARLLASGVDASHILVAVNTDAAARTFRSRLAASGCTVGSGLVVTTPRQAFVDLLAGDDAVRTTGRRPRLLTKPEFNLVLEDLKHAGVPAKTLRAALAKAFRALAQHATTDPSAPIEEGSLADVYLCLIGHLKSLDAMLCEELPAVTTAYLSARCSQGAQAPYRHVLVDDAHNLCPATIEALAGLATTSITIATNPAQAISGFDAGYAHGASGNRPLPEQPTVDVFLTANPRGLSPIAACARALEGVTESLEKPVRGGGAQSEAGSSSEAGEVGASVMSAQSGPHITHIKWHDPTEEFRGVARLVADLLADDPTLLPCDIFIAVPCRAWVPAIRRELDARHIPTHAIQGTGAVFGDPRSRERLGTLEAYACLALATNPEDPAAWRLWLALGEADGACLAWERFCSFAQATGQSIREAMHILAQKDGTAFEGSELVAERARTAEAMLDSLGQKRGFTLRSHLRARCPSPQLTDIFEHAEGDEDASTLFRTFQNLSFAPCSADQPSRVHVGSYQAAQALSPRHVVMPGLVDGLMPAKGRPGAGGDLDAQRRLFANVAGKARDSLTICTFRLADPTLAARLGLDVHRVRRYRGEQVVTVTRSRFIDEAGDTLPGSMSGEQFFALSEGAAAPAAPPAARVVSQLDGVHVIVHQHRCVRVRNRHATCRLCAEACTSGCISYEGGELVVNQDACIACGTCCTACPTCALEAALPNDATLVERARLALRATGGEVIFLSEQACAQAPDSLNPERVVPVASLGRIDESILVELAQTGARHIALVHARAGDAIEDRGVAMARTVCEGAAAILRAWGSPTEIHLTDEVPPCALVDVGRAPRASAAHATDAHGASALRTPDASGANAPLSQAEKDVYRRMKVMRDGTLPHFVPDRHERLVDTLFEMGDPVDVNLETRLWGHVSIDFDRCTGCRLCATFCPTGALRTFTDANGAVSIEHTPGDCVQCRCCQDICRAAAINVGNTVHAPAVLDARAECHPLPAAPAQPTGSAIFHSVQKALGINCLSER